MLAACGLSSAGTALIGGLGTTTGMDAIGLHCTLLLSVSVCISSRNRFMACSGACRMCVASGSVLRLPAMAHMSASAQHLAPCPTAVLCCCSIMGVCPQHDLLWETLTGREHLMFYGRLKGLKGVGRRLIMCVI